MNTESSSGMSAESLAASVYEELKRRLNVGLLKPGEFIDLTALGRELGMSRTPLRDALIRLELERLHRHLSAPRRDGEVSPAFGHPRHVPDHRGLEASVIEEIAGAPGLDADKMESLCAEMTKALPPTILTATTAQTSGFTMSASNSPTTGN